MRRFAPDFVSKGGTAVQIAASSICKHERELSPPEAAHLLIDIANGREFSANTKPIPADRVLSPNACVLSTEPLVSTAVRRHAAEALAKELTDAHVELSAADRQAMKNSYDNVYIRTLAEVYRNGRLA